ncbi:MAG: hypothetical protein FWB85_10555 [Chitinispirillia bacterium]|nr:hypothetical protein [Chitinispirillia bacterium]MCL2242623.1 hypothetical protein [Chitinispirillia bacterium]
MKNNKDLQNDVVGALRATPTMPGCSVDGNFSDDVVWASNTRALHATPLRYGMLFCVIAVMCFFACESPPDYCSRGNRYDPNYEFCFSGKAHKLCSNGKYNPLTQGCDKNNAVATRCLDSSFVPVGTPCGGYTLNIASAPANGGEIQLSSPGPNYAAGDKVSLVAIEAAGYTFDRWTGASTETQSDITLTMNSNQPLIAIFKPNTARLETSAFPPSGGDIERNVNGTQVTVTATAEQGYTFTKWEGAVTSTNPTVTVTVDEGKTLVAMFTPVKYRLTVNTNPANSGTVFVNGTPSSGSTEHDDGTTVRVEAQPMPGYTFMEWSGESVTGNPGTILMAGNRMLTANFRQQTITTPADSTFTDSRDGQVYRTVTIGSQTWMAENLNYDVPGIDTDVCYDNDPNNCDLYGRLYDWATAMNLSSSCNSTDCASQVQTKHRGVCPFGWHVPSDAEWETLVKYVDPNASGNYDNNAGTKLRSTTGWNTSSDYIPGTDEYGFSALPGGNGYFSGGFYDAGYYGYWWSATEGGASYAWGRFMSYGDYVGRYTNYKTSLFSLRCLRDSAASQ